jgi:hypothetical protein
VVEVEVGVGKPLSFCVCGLRLNEELASDIACRLFVERPRMSKRIPGILNLSFFRFSSDFPCPAACSWPVCVVPANRYCAVMCGIVLQNECQQIIRLVERNINSARRVDASIKAVN